MRDFAIGWCVAVAVVVLVWTAGWVSMKERERRIDDTLATAPIANEIAEAIRLLGPSGRDVVRLRVVADDLLDRQRGDDPRLLQPED